MSNKLITIPLCQLKRSKANIRKTDPLSEVGQLAASIEANGLLENLVVRPTTGSSPTECDLYEVVAGGRRLAALNLLVKNKKISKHYGVPCLVLGPREAEGSTEVSLAENIIRAPIHPADQFEAFAKLQKEGLLAEDIGARFGLSGTVVQQRLKLARVSPRLIAEYRSGEMSLEQLMAFTISDDRRSQEATWFDNPVNDRTPTAIRRFLTRALVDGTDRRARFVGAEAYEEAGGTIVRDLFDGENEGYFTDSRLLDLLVSEKLKSLAEEVHAEGWNWTEVVAEIDYEYLTRFDKATMDAASLTSDEEARLTGLCERYDQIVASLEDGDEDGSAELDQVSAEIDALNGKREAWPAEEKGRAGVVIGLDYSGEPQIVRGLVKRAERPVTTGIVGQGATEEKSKSSNGYSEALFVDLSAHYTAALREVVASEPQAALTALLHTMVLSLFYHEGYATCFGLSASTVDLGKLSKTIGQSKAAMAFHSRHDRWLERIPDREKLWPWLATLSEKERLELLALCVAMTTDVTHRKSGSTDRIAYATMVAEAMALDMADWWRPTQDGYFNRITKEQIVAAVSEGASPTAARGLRGLKKDEMGAVAERFLSETRWIPEVLRVRKRDDVMSGAEAAE